MMSLLVPNLASVFVFLCRKYIFARVIAMADEASSIIEGLCHDLFSSRSSDDANSALRLLVSVTATSRAMQNMVSRAFAKGTPVPRFRQLQELYLYDPISSHEALALLAVLAHDNVQNQRRMARHISGLCFVCSSSQLIPTGRVIMVLTLPSILERDCNQWSSRHRALEGYRIPTGTPPTREGVPAPCLCDQCLGMGQLLNTWTQHFHDLSRWTTCGINSETSAPRLRKSTLIQRALADGFILEQHRISFRLGDAPIQQKTSTFVYSFSRQSDTKPLLLNAALHPPDRTRNVCGIEIDPSVASLVSHQPGHHIYRKQLTHYHSSDRDAVNRVVLAELQSVIHYCGGIEGGCHLPADRTLLEILQGNKSVSVASLVNLLDREVRVSDRNIVWHILIYLDASELIGVDTLKHIVARTNSQLCNRKLVPNCTVRLGEVCSVRFAATYSHQRLEIVALTNGNVLYSGWVNFSALRIEPGVDASLFGLCAMDEVSLVELLHHCRLCRPSQDHRPIGESICLLST